MCVRFVEKANQVLFPAQYDVISAFDDRKMHVSGRRPAILQPVLQGLVWIHALFWPAW
jgi:hypothetical protein